MHITAIAINSQEYRAKLRVFQKKVDALYLFFILLLEFIITKAYVAKYKK